MIIDVHAHLGLDHTFDEDFLRADLEAKIAEHAVDVQIVQPGTCHTLDDARAQHDAIAALCRERPGRFLGMANPSPHLPPDAYRAEVRRDVENAQRMGITGVPCFILGGKYAVMGAQSVEALEDAIRQVEAERRAG